MESKDDLESVSPVYSGNNETAIFPEDFFEETNVSNWESPQREIEGDLRSENLDDISNLNVEDAEMDSKCFSMRDMQRIIAFSNSILLEKIGRVPIKKEKITPPCVKSEHDSQLPRQPYKSGEGKREQVYKKNYCVVSADHLKSLERIQFSMASKHKNHSFHEAIEDR